MKPRIRLTRTDDSYECFDSRGRSIGSSPQLAYRNWRHTVYQLGRMDLNEYLKLGGLLLARFGRT